MSETVTVRAPLGKTTVVKLKRVEQARAPKPKPALGRPTGGARARFSTWGAIPSVFTHLGASLGRAPRAGASDPTTDVVNVWLTDQFEASARPQPHEIRDYSDEMRRRALPPPEPIRYLYSDRELPGYGYPLSAVALVSGWNAALRLARVRAPDEQPDAARPDRFYGLQHNADYVHPQRSADEALADWDGLREQFENSTDLDALARWRRQRDQIERRKLESFDNESGRFAGRDMTLLADKLTPGLYSPSFTAGDQFYQWDPEDIAQYRTVMARGDRRQEMEGVSLATGGGTTTRLRCGLVPRRHEILFSWVAVYVNIILFTVPVYTVEQNIGVYYDILPLDWAFIGAEDDLRNAAAMSRRISRSQRYAVSLDQDLGSQSFSPYYVKLLAGRADGQWAVRAGDRNIGDPCAFLDAERGDGSTDRYEITRKTFIVGGERLNFSPLATGEVQPMSPDGQQVWPGLPYGNL
jgi:hypothetical protein